MSTFRRKKCPTCGEMMNATETFWTCENCGEFKQRGYSGTAQERWPAPDGW